MIKGELLDSSIPIDLIIYIFSRLPVKSIVRFRCVSKLWESMFHGPYFTELFVTRSSVRPPRLLFVVGDNKNWCFFTSPQPQNPYEKSSSSSLVIAANFHMKFHGGCWPDDCEAVSGLIYFEPMRDDRMVICNPSTGQYVSLPLPEGNLRLGSFLGFDPIDKQFKVLSYEYKEGPDQILTLGSWNQSWKKIHCPLNHDPCDEGICINGVFYYSAMKIDAMIVCFDVRSEKFKFIYRDFFRPQHLTKLINYKGTLGVITLEDNESSEFDRSRSLEVCMYVIKDVEKPESSEWLKYSTFVDNCDLIIVGATATGGIVLSTKDPSKPFYVFFLNLEKNTRQRVEIKGFKATGSSVKVFVDHVEDLNFINMKTTLTSSIIVR